MESSAVHGRGPAGRPGSIENPEVHEDVPGHVIPILEREFEDFETEATKFLDGETPEDQFIAFRLKQGVYGQRQPGVQMIRVKLPFGGVTPEQMDAFADVIERYVRPGDVRVELRPLANIGPDSETGRNAAIAAGDQRKLFNFSQITYLNQGVENSGWLDEEFVTRAASSIPGLKVPKLLADQGSAATAKAAAAYDAQADHDSVDGTPTILVGPTGGPFKTVAMTSATDGAAVAAAIEAARAT